MSARCPRSFPSMCGLGLGAVLGLVAACTTTDRPLEWEVEVPSSMRDRTAYLEATIHEGDCAVAGRLRYRSEFLPGEMAAAPPSLAPGLYAFSATAIDEGCTPLGVDCETVTLPLEGGAPVTLSLGPTALPPLCAPSLCSDGRCIEGDAGAADAGEPDADLPCTFGDRTAEGCFVPSNVPPAVLADLGDGLVVVPAGETWLLRTDSGAIEAYEVRPIVPGAEPTRVVREAGAGMVDGIGFELADQEGGTTPLGVFSFAALRIPEGAAVTATGAAALVLVARSQVEVSGDLSVAADAFEQPPHPTTDWALMPGPGGAAGGVRCSEETSPGMPGGGLGGGGFGAAVGGEPTQGGGGGASFGGLGGGGGLGGAGVPGGAPGAAYGSASLRPLEGGSGGGPGGEADCGKGGAGGGALQIVAGVAITITGTVDASGAAGAGGRGGTDSGAGGGGGSGGAILLEAPAVSVFRGLQSSGGGGGAGCPANDPDARGAHGAHGSRGPAAAGGVGNGRGGSGGPGSDIAGAGGSGAQDDNGGGGGGGGGLIRVNADPDRASLDTSIPHAPSIASGLMSVGVIARVP